MKMFIKLMIIFVLTFSVVKPIPAWAQTNKASVCNTLMGAVSYFFDFFDHDSQRSAAARHRLIDRYGSIQNAEREISSEVARLRNMSHLPLHIYFAEIAEKLAQGEPFKQLFDEYPGYVIDAYVMSKF
jgi:hypothetical protein